MNKSKKNEKADPRFWSRWRFSGAVPAEAVLAAARAAVARATFAPPAPAVPVEMIERRLPNGIQEVRFAIFLP